MFLPKGALFDETFIGSIEKMVESKPKFKISLRIMPSDTREGLKISSWLHSKNIFRQNVGSKMHVINFFK